MEYRQGLLPDSTSALKQRDYGKYGCSNQRRRRKDAQVILRHIHRPFRPIRILVQELPKRNCRGASWSPRRSQLRLLFLRIGPFPLPDAALHRIEYTIQFFLERFQCALGRLSGHVDGFSGERSSPDFGKFESDVEGVDGMGNVDGLVDEERPPDAEVSKDGRNR